ncbi:MAG: hypothetical protein II475_02905 [Bacteroidales bacterium]|nr:hypothetical protein [Bacteroidales bacterium]
MLVFLGLNLFTACYGPAPGVREYQEVEPTEQTESTKAEDEVEAEEESAGEETEKAE